MKYSYNEVFESAYAFFKDEIATNVWINKYAMRDDNGNFLERVPNDMFKRIAKEFFNIVPIEQNVLSSDDFNNLSELGKQYYNKSLTESDFFELFKNFERVIPQGSVLSQLGHKYSIGSLSNCTVVDAPFDSYNGIIKSDLELANLMKRRCGVGLDISTLRPENAKVSNAANTSTGAVSFMERYSNTTKEVSQNGRRGALMISIDVRHPNTQQFAIIKNNKDKVNSANISIKLTDDFMNKVKNDEDFLHVWPIETNTTKYNIQELPYNVLVEKNGIYIKRVKAKTLWSIIVKSARDHAEPGLLFWDKQHKYSTSSVYPQFENISTNPCVVGDTVVLTTIGLIKIKNLKDYINQDVKIITQDANCNFFESALKWVDITTKNDDIFEIEFSNGSIQRTNKTHKFYRPEDFSEIEVQNLKTGDWVIGYKEPIRIVGITPLIYKEDVWDLTAKPNYNFFGIYGLDEIPMNIKVEDGKIVAYQHQIAILNNLILNVDCSEIAMGANDSCRLVSTNMFSHVNNQFKPNSEFDFNKWYETIYYGLIINDLLVDLEIQSINNILYKIKSDPEPDYIKEPEIKMWEEFKRIGEEGRRTGLGFTGLGDTIAALGYKYDSPEAQTIIESIMKTKFEAELTASIDLAIMYSHFKGYDNSIENKSELNKKMKSEFPELYSKMKKYGRRNVSISTVAPTGTISLLANNVTSGIEPLFMPFYTRRKKVNPNDEKVRVDYKDQSGDSWQEFNISHPNFKKWALSQDDSLNFEELKEEELNGLFEQSPYYKSTAHDIDWKKRIEMQSIIQKYTSHSISSTINLDKDVSLEEVAQIYMYAWESGLKGITVYRDGARDGVLITNKDTQQNTLNEFFDGSVANFRSINKIIKVHAPKRPEKLYCDIHNLTAKGQRWTVLVGMLKEEPYEVWAYMNNNNDIKQKTGIIHKFKRGGYSLLDDNNKVLIKNLNDLMIDDEENLTRQISLSLRTGADMKYVVNSLNKSKGSIVSFAKAIARTLSKYVKLTIDDIEKMDKKCEECGDPDGLIFENGCFSCKSCGSSKCGS